MTVAGQHADECTQNLFLVEGAPDALLLLDSRGTIRTLNPAAEALFGHSKEDLSGESYTTLLPERFAGTEQDFLNVFGADTPSIQLGKDVELFGLHRDGAEFPVEVNVRTRRGEGELMMIASVRDVTARKHRDLNLRHALSLVTATLESTADGGSCR